MSDSETKTDTNEREPAKKTLSLGSRGKSTLTRHAGDANQVRQSFSHGRSKTVQVEVKRKRAVERSPAEGDGPRRDGTGRGRGRTLTNAEREARDRALQSAREDEARRPADELMLDGEPMEAAAPAPTADAADAAGSAPAVEAVPEPVAPEPLDPEALRAREVAELQTIEAAERARAEQETKRLEEAERQRAADRARAPQDDETRRREVADRAGSAAAAKIAGLDLPEEEDSAARRARPGGAKRPPPAPSRAGRGAGARRRTGAKMTVAQALSSDEGERTRSLASVRRARERARHADAGRDQEKVVRDVIVPETITVQELANRMAERGGDVVKTLFRMGVMVTINQTIDADTAELVVTEMGHRIRRVSDADVEIGMHGEDDTEADKQPRPPVVTVMGHVDHGKTSLLDALRSTDVVSREAGGITQHIGAYQVTLDSGQKITFIDTPGHAAFTSMRARGANTTDIVILVVAANDGVMPQTVEAIRHARAANVPIVVAINKCDLPDADPDRVRADLLQHEIVVESMGGEVQAIEVSAKSREGLETLAEAVLLQAELLELKANPDRAAEGVVIEAKLERGRGSVATVLVQRGTLKVGEIFVAGSEWGRVRALANDRAEPIEAAGPAEPVEVLGLNGVPLAGDDFVVVDNEGRAREITDFRNRKKREAQQVANARGTLEQMFDRIQSGEAKQLPLLIKGDVQGSVEAIAQSLTKLAEDNAEVEVRVLHSAVGGINESDITLATASDALIVGFNVRANPQARELARRDGTDIRYYSVIYDVIDDVRQMLTGLLAPSLRETFLGNAEIREVFNISRTGKVAGCYVTDGLVRRGASVRLLRDNVVIHEGKLKTLRRFKDEVREVTHSYECGMAFENYDDIKVGDVIEAFEMQEVAREL